MTAKAIWYCRQIAREIPGEYFMATIRTAINRQGNVFLWPIRMPGPDGKILEWHRSAAEAAAVAPGNGCE